MGALKAFTCGSAAMEELFFCVLREHCDMMVAVSTVTVIYGPLQNKLFVFIIDAFW